MSKLLIHAWYVEKYKGQYFLPYTHWIYLKEIFCHYDEVHLLSMVKNVQVISGHLPITGLGSIQVIELPYSGNYLKSVILFRHYLIKFKSLDKTYTTIYTRYPTPFGWLSKFFFRKTSRIIHFVGDPIDAAKNNPNFSAFKKSVLIRMFMPEHMMYMWACKGARVFCNGYHLKERLDAYHIEAVPLISTTLNTDDYYYDSSKAIEIDNIKLLYVGYLRKAKGIETIIRAFTKIVNQYPRATLSIVGTGESETALKLLAKTLNVEGSVNFLGHIEDRGALNKIIRGHDIFCFASLSEGSPRVILEAMANGLNVISTPVGSLPFVFKPGIEILFADFNDADSFYSQINYLINDEHSANFIRANAFNRAKEFTIGNFIEKIFHEH